MAKSVGYLQLSPSHHIRTVLKGRPIGHGPYRELKGLATLLDCTEAEETVSATEFRSEICLKEDHISDGLCVNRAQAETHDDRSFPARDGSGQVYLVRKFGGYPPPPLRRIGSLTTHDNIMGSSGGFGPGLRLALESTILQG